MSVLDLAWLKQMWKQTEAITFKGENKDGKYRIGMLRFKKHKRRRMEMEVPEQ
jgi:hypothetical protein